MRKTICITLCVILILLCTLSASACSNAEELIQKNTINLEAVNTLSATTIAPPDQNSAAVSAEDTIYYGINEFDLNNVLPLTPTTVNNARTVNAIRLEFGGAVPNSYYSDFVEHICDAGDSATLYIDTCVWAPEAFDLEIGITNFRTGEHWYVVRSGGSVINRTITFRNLTAGHYSVTIRNLGTSALSTGYLLYTLDL